MGQRSGPAFPRRRREEVRSRKGCWKCRERRVKCPEQRPVCRHCERLGFVCAYDFRLTWQAIVTSDYQKPTVGRVPRVVVRRWMFLNTVHDDFNDKDEWGGSSRLDTLSLSDAPSAVASISGPESRDDMESISPLPTSSSSTHDGTPVSPPESHQAVSPQPSLSPLSLQDDTNYLWSYFEVFITPHCSLNDTYNPYRDILLRIAASSPDGPLFHCILAASAIQLHNLGHAKFKSTMWGYRARALSSLRELVYASHLAASPGWEDRGSAVQIMGSAVMLTFFEILQDCSETWTIHAEFGQSYLQHVQSKYELLSEHKNLVQFSSSYFSIHSTLAGTASPRIFNRTPISRDYECGSNYDTTVQTLSGCSDRLLDLIAEITELAYDQEVLELTAEFTLRRQSIERQLHELQRPPQPDLALEDEELGHVAEAKRLTALLYLHSRIDNAGPQEPHMVRLTAQILLLLQAISLRTNTILWTLFMVATLGVRPESDADRKLVLERLTALQETRQLGNVKKARQIIEDVWKARDLRKADTTRGWSILTDKYGTISLA